MNSNNNLKFTTVGQKLLKEPIWIGMIVVFNLLIIFGISYVIKRKCAKYLICCKDTKDILREREDEIPAHCNNPLSSTPNISPQISVEVISESSGRPPSRLNRRKIVNDHVADISLETPKPSTPTVDITNREAAAKLFASYDKQLTFPFDTNSPITNRPMGLHPVGGLKSGVLEFNAQEKENYSENSFVLKTPPLPNEYRQLWHSQTTAVFDTKSDRVPNESNIQVIRSKSLTPGIMRERRQSPVVTINEPIVDSSGVNEIQTLDVPDQSKRRSSFKDMTAEDKRRLFSKCKSSYPERSYIPCPDVQRSNSNREVLILSQSDDWSSDTLNRNSLDFMLYSADGYKVVTNKLSFSDSKVFDRTRFSSDNSTTSASVNEVGRNKTMRKRKYYIRIVKKSRSRKYGHSRSKDSSLECSCGSGGALSNVDTRKRRQKKKTRAKVETTDSSSDKEDFYPLRKTTKSYFNNRTRRKHMINGQTQTNKVNDNAVSSTTNDNTYSNISRFQGNGKFNQNEYTDAYYYTDKNKNGSSSNPSETDGRTNSDGERKVAHQLSYTGYLISSKRPSASSWIEDGKIPMHVGNDSLKWKPFDSYITKQYTRSTNSFNNLRVKDSAYETIQSSLDTMSFEKPQDKSCDTFYKRHNDRRITNQLEQVSLKLSMLRNRHDPKTGHSPDGLSFATSDNEMASQELDYYYSGRRSSRTGTINKAFTLEHVSEEGDTVNTPEQISLSELPETQNAVSRSNLLKTGRSEDIEMVEFMV